MKAQYCFGCMNELAGQVERCPYCHTVLPYRMQDPNDLPAGMILKKRYLVGRSLGRGGFGATYIARDLKKDKILTIKEYFPEFACVRNPGSNFVAFKSGKEDKFLSYQKEFKAEAQHLKMLRDIPGVVQYCDYFEAFGTSYLVMTYLEGKTLKDTQLDQHRPFSIQEGVDYTLRTLQVLSRVHGKGILHRDISPDNIFVTANGQVNLIDFGSSSLLSQTTMTGFTKGVYTAPEQRINGAQGPATDLYAVGVTLFTLLTNHKPKEAEGIHLEEMPDAFPQAIRDVYLKATQREMSQRYQSADEMAKALSLATGIPMPPPLSNRKKKLKNLLMAMLALVAVLVVAMVLAFSGNGEQPATPEVTNTPVAATATPVVTEAPTSTPVPALPEDSWLCRMNGQLYRVSAQGAEVIDAGTFPVEETKLQAIELQGLESCQLIYELDKFEIIHTATGHHLPLTGVEDSITLELLPGEYSLRVTKDDRMLAEGFTVPAQGPVTISAAGETTLESWWNVHQAAVDLSTATPDPLPAATAHQHQWEEKETKAATCGTQGSRVQECLICGEQGETAMIPALGHDWRAATCTTPKTCTRCTATEGAADGHRWNTVSCTEPSTCTVCGERSGSGKGHSWGSWHGDAATCTSGGVEEHICGECGQRETRTTSALGHAPGAAATCTTAQKCTRCGETLKIALGHTWQNATCMAPKTCTVCGATEGNAKAHRWRVASCTEPKTCTVCKTTEGDPKGHNWQEATCTTPMQCVRCKQTNGNANGHVWSAASCTSPSTCTVCGATTGSGVGHSWGNWHGDTATCTAAGSEERICGSCGQRETRNTSALGHEYGVWKLVQEATCTNPQVSRRICGYCGEQEWHSGTETENHAYINGVCVWCQMPVPDASAPEK